MKTSSQMNTSAVGRFFSESRNIRIIREGVIAGVMVFLLMGLISPFNVETLGDRRLSYFLAVSVSTMVTAFAVGLFTAYVLKMPLDARLPLAKVHRNSVVLFLVNTPVLAAILTTLNGAYNYGHACDIWFRDGHFTLVPYAYFLYYIGASTVFLYIGVYVRNKNWQLRESLREVREINRLLEERQERLAHKEAPGSRDGAAVGNTDADDSHKCCLKGSTNESRLVVAAEDVIYVESMANYASVWYLQDGVPMCKTLRITLKQVRESLDAVPSMLQCHRAFIVNLNFVVAMTNRNSGYQLRVFGTDKQIPVSRTYAHDLRERLKKA